MSHPVWEWRGDGSEQLVRRAELMELPDPLAGTPVYIAAAEYLAASTTCSP